MMMVTWVSPFGLDDAEDYFEENNDTDEMPGEIYEYVIFVFIWNSLVKSNINCKILLVSLLEINWPVSILFYKIT